MKRFHVLGMLACAAFVAAGAPSASAENTFNIPAGAHFNPKRLDRVARGKAIDL